MLRAILAAALVACAATRTHAQEIVFRGIRWGTPADSVQARLEAQGYAYRGVVDRGDRAFGAEDGTRVKATLRAGRVVGFSWGVPLDSAADVGARYTAVADSLERALGTPADRRPDSRSWEAGLTTASVHHFRDSSTGLQVVETDWRGPGWFDEMDGRGMLLQLPPIPVGHTAVRMTSGSRISVDTASLAVRTGGILRARWRTDYVIRAGRPDDRYDAIEYGMDFDCAGSRTRMVSRTTWLNGRRTRSESSEGLPWAPARGGTDGALGLDAVCRVKGSGPAIAAKPAETRTFAAVDAKWVTMFESREGRWLMDTTSVTRKPGGTLDVVVRTDWGATRGGQADAMRMHVEVDCAGQRTRILSATLMLRGRDVGTTPVPPEMRAWQSAQETAASSGIAQMACPRASQR